MSKRKPEDEWLYRTLDGATIPLERERDAAEILEGALRKAQEPGTWTKDTYAKDERGQPTHATAGNAVQFCTLGYVHYSQGRHRSHSHLTRIAAIQTIYECLPEKWRSVSIGRWNDARGRRQDQVVKLLEKALARQRERVAERERRRRGR